MNSDQKLLLTGKVKRLLGEKANNLTTQQAFIFDLGLEEVLQFCEGNAFAVSDTQINVIFEAVKLDLINDH